MALEQAKTMFQGESRTFRLTVTQASDSQRVDLTGSTIEFQVKAADGDADPALIEKEIGTGITLLAQTGATKGQADIDLSPSDTSSLAPAIYRYDVVVVLVSGKRFVVVPPSDLILRAVVNQA